MPANDKEVWEYFGGSDDNQEVNFLAFGSFSFDKFEWMGKFVANNGRPPTNEETNHWISELPDSRLDEMREWAQTFFDSAARAYLEDEHNQAVQNAVHDALVNRVTASNDAVKGAVISSNTAVLAQVSNAVSLKNTWIPSVLLGIVSSFMFAILIWLAAIIYAKDPSPIGLLKDATGANAHSSASPAGNSSANNSAAPPGAS